MSDTLAYVLTALVWAIIAAAFSMWIGVSDTLTALVVAIAVVLGIVGTVLAGMEVVG